MIKIVCDECADNGKYEVRVEIINNGIIIECLKCGQSRVMRSKK